jgi:hypothetical protein
MTIEAFKVFVSVLKKHDELNHKFYKLGLDTMSLVDNAIGAMSTLLKSHYSEEGEDLISWWLYEDVDKKLYLNDGSEIDLTKIEDLWAYVEEIRKSPNFKEYVPKNKKMTKKQMNKFFDDFFNSKK